MPHKSSLFFWSVEVHLFFLFFFFISRAYLSHLRAYDDQCNSVLSDINEATEHLQRLKQQYGHVSTRTGVLHSACEQLLADQTRLVTTAESISEKLVFFDELETISHVSLNLFGHSSSGVLAADIRVLYENTVSSVLQCCCSMPFSFSQTILFCLFSSWTSLINLLDKVYVGKQIRILNTTQNWVVSRAFRSIAHQTCTWRQCLQWTQIWSKIKTKLG